MVGGRDMGGEVQNRTIDAAGLKFQEGKPNKGSSCKARKRMASATKEEGVRGMNSGREEVRDKGWDRSCSILQEL